MEWTDWDQAPRWDKFSDTAGLTESQRDALRSALMADRQLRLSETFASYGSERLPKAFWEEQWQDWLYTMQMPTGDFTGGDWVEGQAMETLVPSDRNLLKKALKRSYVARSGFVHSGDRSVGLRAEMLARAIPQGDSRLSFPALRLVLRGLINTEMLARRDSAASLPPIVFTLEPL